MLKHIRGAAALVVYLAVIAFAEIVDALAHIDDRGQL